MSTRMERWQAAERVRAFMEQWELPDHRGPRGDDVGSVRFDLGDGLVRLFASDIKTLLESPGVPTIKPDPPLPSIVDYGYKLSVAGKIHIGERMSLLVGRIMVCGRSRPGPGTAAAFIPGVLAPETMYTIDGAHLCRACWNSGYGFRRRRNSFLNN